MTELRWLYKDCIIEVFPEENGRYISFCKHPNYSGVYVSKVSFNTVEAALEDGKARADKIYSQ